MTALVKMSNWTMVVATTATVATTVITSSTARAQTQVPAPTETKAETETGNESSNADPSLSSETTGESVESVVVPPTGEKTGEKTETPTMEPPDHTASALSESGLSNLKGQGNYRKPLLFAPEDNGLGLASPQIKWDFDKGRRVNLGGLKIEAASIGFQLSQFKYSELNSWFRNSERADDLVTNISFSWPHVLTRTGTVFIEVDGKRIWSRRIDEDAREDWKNLIGGKSGDPHYRPHAKSSWGLLDALFEEKFKLPAAGQTFHACLENIQRNKEKLVVCTGPLALRASGKTLSVVNPTKAPHARNEGTVYLDDKPIGPRGIVNFRPGRRVHLKIVFGDDSSIDITSQPIELRLLDVVESGNGNDILLTGEGEKPLGSVKIISSPATHFWSRTGVKQEDVWQLAIPREAPTVRMLGAFNIPFTMLFKFDRLPKESDRVYVSDRVQGTYSSSPRLTGYTPGNGKISSTEFKAKNTEDGYFEWKFAARKRGTDNRARLSVMSKGSDRAWVAHHELHRGYPFEASGRLTGIVTSDAQTVILGELAASGWAEDLGFTNNEWLARQRWGLTARYLKSLSSIALGEGVVIDNLSVLNIDLKYNILNGNWNRDELIGLIVSLEQVKLANLSANLYGFGGYWSRTMPKIIDDLLNLLPFMRFPKYADVEFIYYNQSASAGVEPGQSYSLNFHGKVFWSKRAYGEAGFGLKSFEFNDLSQNSSLSFATAYGTVGWGVIF